MFTVNNRNKCSHKTINTITSIGGTLMVAMQSRCFNTMEEAQKFVESYNGRTNIVPEVDGWYFDTKGRKHRIPKTKLKVWVDFDFQ